MKQRPNGFPRPFRIRASADFARAYKDGSRARGDLLLVIARQNPYGFTRLGLSVGKRIWKSAVRRNRVRRLFREAFRLEHDELPPGMDLVLIPAQPGLEPELASTRRELVRLARKAARRQLEKIALEAQASSRALAQAALSAQAQAEAQAEASE